MRTLASIALLLCTLHGASGYVFSCEEIKAKLVNTPRLENTLFACVFLEEGLSSNTAYLQNVFLQDQQDKTSYSLASVAASATGCIRGNGPWQVVSDRAGDLRCDREIALLFSSDQQTQYLKLTEDSQQIVASNGRVTFVSPRAGMRITVNDLNSDITVYTGAGKGSSEFLFPLKTWGVYEAPRYIASFDNVLTIETASRTTLFVASSEYQNATRLSAGDRAAILTSGKSDNLMNKHPEQNYVTYDLWQPAAAANVTGNLFFDKSYQGFINITVRGDYENEEITFQDSVIDYVFYGSFFEVKYLTSVMPDQVWDNEDTFVIELQMNDVPPEITPIPGRLTEEPRQAITTIYEQPTTQRPAEITTQKQPDDDAPVSDKYCNCAIKDDWFDDWDPADIWVDVVILLDTSASMGNSLEEAKALITSFLYPMTTDTSAEFYSRIGVIALSDTAQVIYNLNMSNTDDLDMVKKHNVAKIDVQAGFKAALKMFADGESFPSYRENTKQIIYYLTNSAPGANLDGVEEFKSDGGIIIVNDFVLEGDVPSPDLRKLASDNFFFTDLSENYVNSLSLFCEVNCFCNPNMHAFNDDNISPRTTANRGCFHPVNTGIPQPKAKETCQKSHGTLVSIHDAQKEHFINSVVSVFGAKKKYWIGYENVNNQWVWDDKSTDPFSDWDAAQPNTNGGKLTCAYAVQTTGLNVKWTAANCAMGGIIYVCETAPCSRGNKNCGGDAN